MTSGGADLKAGDPAPEFAATAVGGKYGAGEFVTLSDLRGQPVVLYFYPKDNTPGCTIQACSLRDSWGELGDRAEIFGVSTDSAASHQKFIARFKLPFPLLADNEKNIARAYGVLMEKNILCLKIAAAERTTFVIDARGQIATVLRKVKASGHVDQLRAALDALK